MKTHIGQTGSDFQEVYSVLKDLALDLGSSWNHSIHMMWKRLDPELWNRTHNPLLLLSTVSRERLMQVFDTRDFQQCLRDVLLEKQRDRELAPSADHASSTLQGAVAYFSMEYMLSEALPIYSGGLGNVAGDQLKAANDLNLPIIGVGMLYQQGYFRQEIDAAGQQQALFPFNNPAELPITPVRSEDGEWVRVQLTRPNFSFWLRAWQARVGSVTLYLLDTNDPANHPFVRLIGSELYGDGPQLRLRQELVLGMGGYRLLRQLGIEPTVCHLNEGHAAFAILERAYCFMQDTGHDFRVALEATRPGNIFTTHTPVDAGFDRFSPQLMESHLKFYAEEYLNVSFDELMALGRKNPNDRNEPFNMAYLALRGSAAANGVSRVHGTVSRRIFQDRFPRWPEAEVPIGHVTNGVHLPTWASAEASALWNEGLAQSTHDITPASISGHIEPDVLSGITDQQLWDFRCRQRAKLVEYARRQFAVQYANIGFLDKQVATPGMVLDPNVLTLAFARRFAEYKRPTLLLQDPERLMRLLADAAQPAQLIVAGKAHPADRQGQDMIKAWNDYISQYGLQHRIVFLADYDMRLTQALVRGADIWINTPRRPWEASGTSGMKVLVNGGLNVSVLDGWWAEAYSPEVGFAIEDRDGGSDAADAQELYRVLEAEVKPAFYSRTADGIPLAWAARMRASMSRLTPAFSANRVVSDYLRNYYAPAERAYQLRSAESGRLAAEIVQWRQRIERAWDQVRVVSRQVNVASDVDPDRHYDFLVHVDLGVLLPTDVTVELFAGGEDGSLSFPLSLQGSPSESLNPHVYAGVAPASRPDSHYTVRIRPYHPQLRLPYELNLIRWEK